VFIDRNFHWNQDAMGIISDVERVVAPALPSSGVSVVLGHFVEWDL
jgi:hypothetical protein